MHNSHSLTEFQRNAHSYISTIQRMHEPILLTEDGEVQAVLLDLSTYEAMEAELEQVRFREAVAEGEADIRAGRHQPAGEVFAALRIKHGF